MTAPVGALTLHEERPPLRVWRPRFFRALRAARRRWFALWEMRNKPNAYERSRGRRTVIGVTTKGRRLLAIREARDNRALNDLVQSAHGHAAITRACSREAEDIVRGMGITVEEGGQAIERILRANAPYGPTGLPRPKPLGATAPDPPISPALPLQEVKR